MTFVEVEVVEESSVKPVVKGTEYDKLIHDNPSKNKRENNVTKYMFMPLVTALS